MQSGEWESNCGGADGFAFFFFGTTQGTDKFHPFFSLFPLATPPLEIADSEKRTAPLALLCATLPFLNHRLVKTTSLDPSLDIGNRWAESKESDFNILAAQPNQPLKVCHPTTCLVDVSPCQVLHCSH